MLLQGQGTVKLIVGILVVKSIIWAVSLGSGTSGGVLAPLLMMGGALGGTAAMVLPNEGAGFWPLVSMGAILAGTMGSPFTGVVFALELTHDVNMLLPLMIACIVAYGLAVLTLRRSILTEKIARHGYHLSREYSTDPLEILFVREVMRTNIAALPPSLPLKELAQSMRSDHRRSQRLFPVVDREGGLAGVVTRSDLRKFLQAHSGEAFPDEPLRAVVNRMAATGITRLLVVAREDPRKLVGIISLNDLLKARVRNLEDERRRERVLNMRRIFPIGAGGPPGG